MRAHQIASSLFATLMFSTATALAQQAPDLPQPSPKAKVEQRVGLTDVAVEYSSPGVKNRSIWGALVPHDAPWRTGANAPTRLSSSRDFSFGGKAVPKGSYALYTIPGKASWTVILSSSTEGWNNGFDAKTEVARISVKPVRLVQSRERLAFIFSQTADDATRLDLEWEKLRLPIPLTFDTKNQAQANIKQAVDDAWRPHFASARYLLDNNGDLAKALEYVNASIAIKATWWNHWVRAQIAAKQGNVAEAIASGDKAIELGKGDRVFEGFFKADVDKAVAGWKKKKT